LYVSDGYRNNCEGCIEGYKNNGVNVCIKLDDPCEENHKSNDVGQNCFACVDYRKNAGWLGCTYLANPCELGYQADK